MQCLRTRGILIKIIIIMIIIIPVINKNTDTYELFIDLTIHIQKILQTKKHFHCKSLKTIILTNTIRLQVYYYGLDTSKNKDNTDVDGESLCSFNSKTRGWSACRSFYFLYKR